MLPIWSPILSAIDRASCADSAPAVTAVASWLVKDPPAPETPLAAIFCPTALVSAWPFSPVTKDSPNEVLPWTVWYCLTPSDLLLFIISEADTLPANSANSCILLEDAPVFSAKSIAASLALSIAILCWTYKPTIAPTPTANAPNLEVSSGAIIVRAINGIINFWDISPIFPGAIEPIIATIEADIAAVPIPEATLCPIAPFALGSTLSDPATLISLFCFANLSCCLLIDLSVAVMPVDFPYKWFADCEEEKPDAPACPSWRPVLRKSSTDSCIPTIAPCAPSCAALRIFLDGDWFWNVSFIPFSAAKNNDWVAFDDSYLTFFAAAE